MAGEIFSESGLVLAAETGVFLVTEDGSDREPSGLALRLRPARLFQQPQVAVQIDWSHPLADGLVFFQIPSHQGAPDLVGDGKPTIFGDVTTLTTGPSGRAISSPSLLSSGWETPYRSDRFRAATNEFTMATCVDITGITTSSKLITVPLENSTWSAPFLSFALGRSNATTQATIRFAQATGTTLLAADFPTNTFTTGNGISYVATRSGTTARLLRNGTWHSPTSNTIDSGAVRWGGATKVSLMNRNGGNNGEGTQGRMYYAAVWSRALSEAEARSFQANPYQILRPATTRTLFAFPPVEDLFTGTSAATFPKFTTTASGLRGVLGTSAATLPKFTTSTTGTRSGGQFGPSAATLPKLGGEAEASRGLPPYEGTSSATLPKLRSEAGSAVVGTSRSGSGEATFPKLTATASATRSAPLFTTTSAATLPKFTATAAATRSVQALTATSALIWPGFAGRIDAIALPPAGTIVPLTVDHRRAPSWRLVDAGTGQSGLAFASPLDPNSHTYFTVDWSQELGGSSDTIWINQSAIQATLAPAAIVAGLALTKVTFDGTSVTVWLAITEDQQSASRWVAGETHLMNFTVKTMSGQVFNRDVSVTVRQL